MKERHIQRIFWNDSLKDVVYTYGSNIRFMDDGVLFENLTFASGKPIKKWRSRTNYQAHRTSPELPLLIPGATYRLEAHVEVEPADTITIQIEYRNLQNEVFKSDSLRGNDMQFTFPKEAFTYEIILSGAGCYKLAFKYLDLFAINPKHHIILEPVQMRTYTFDNLPEELFLVAKQVKQVTYENKTKSIFD